MEADIERCQWRIQDPVKNLWWSFCGNSTLLTSSSKQDSGTSSSQQDSDTGVFWWVLQNFLKKPFLQNTSRRLLLFLSFCLCIPSHFLHTNCFYQLLFFLNWIVYYVFKLKTLIALVLLTWGFLLLTASFDVIWNSIEYVINLGDIWRYLSKTFDIWVERYLTIFNDDLAIFGDRNVHTWTRKLSPKRYHQISPFIA